MTGIGNKYIRLKVSDGELDYEEAITLTLIDGVAEEVVDSGTSGGSVQGPNDVVIQNISICQIM